MEEKNEKSDCIIYSINFNTYITLCWWDRAITDHCTISNIINCYRSLEENYKNKEMYEKYTLITNQLKTGDFGRLFATKEEITGHLGSEINTFNSYFNELPAYDFLIEYNDETKELIDLKTLPDKQIKPDKNPIAPKKMKAKM